MYSGWINLNKDTGISSAKAINKLKKLIGVKKAGHAGTLDPMASGVLPVALGEATKTMSFAVNSNKAYEFDISWGIETDSNDSEGNILATCQNRPLKREIEVSLARFTGLIMQKPPIFSAIRVKGERSYKLARKNINFELNAREVFIDKLELSRYINPNKSRFYLECNKGVYVRSLARDLGKILETYGHITYLKRLTVGSFLHKDAILLADIEKLVDKSKLLDILKPISFVLDDIPAIDIDKDKAKLLSLGQKVSIEKGIKNLDSVFVSCNTKPVALAKINNEYILPYRIFNNYNEEIHDVDNIRKKTRINKKTCS